MYVRRRPRFHPPLSLPTHTRALAAAAIQLSLFYTIQSPRALIRVFAQPVQSSHIGALFVLQGQQIGIVCSNLVIVYWGCPTGPHNPNFYRVCPTGPIFQ